MEPISLDYFRTLALGIPDLSKDDREMMRIFLVDGSLPNEAYERFDRTIGEFAAVWAKFEAERMRIEHLQGK